MIVNKQLLERYHTGQCTAEERKCVEDWLDDATLEGDLTVPEPLKTVARRHIWEAVSSAIVVEEQPGRGLRPVRWRWLGYAIGAAASVALVCWLWPPMAGSGEDVLDNRANAMPLWYKQSGYDVLVGEASRATIDIRTGKLEVEGNLVFRPKRDIQIQNGDGMMLLKRGETYFVLEGAQLGNRFIFSSNELTFLPPAMQRKLKQELTI